MDSGKSLTLKHSNSDVRSEIRSELEANIELVNAAGVALELAEIEMREAFDALSRAVDARNVRAKAYGAGARNINRMLAGVVTARINLGDGDDAARQIAPFFLVDPMQYDEVEWPEDQWPQSEIINPEGFDLDEIVG